MEAVISDTLQIMTMKESQDAAYFDSESYGSKENHEFNCSGMDASSIAFEANDKDYSSKYKVIYDFSMDTENGTIDSPTKEDQSGLSHHRSGDKDADSLSSDSYDMDKEKTSPEHDASDLFETDTDLFTDKNVLDCDEPELEVCYKEIDIQILKDICVDEGMLEKDINVIGSCKNEKPSNLCLGYANSLFANECGSEEENDDKKLVSQRTLESSLGNSLEKDTTKHFDLENSVQTGEVNYGATDKVKTDSLEDSLACNKLTMQDSGEVNKVPRLPDQILDEKPVSESHVASSAQAGDTGEDVKACSLLYNSKVEGQSITFNFKSPVLKVVDNGNSINENTKEQSAVSEDPPKDTNAEYLSDSGEVKRADVQTVEQDVRQHEQRNSGNVSVVSQLQQDEGETSFSSAGLISYSGRIAFSGSLSHRSDGSTTSGRSFAFPILQSEWNSSPVRMAKADRRHFRKHKCWRSGLLCCRF